MTLVPSLAMNIRFPVEKLPRKIIVTPPFNDEEFEGLCLANRHVPLERTKDGEIVVNSPRGFKGSVVNSEVTYQLKTWWKTHRRGGVVGSDTGFFLPDGSMLCPDAAYVTQNQLDGLKVGDKQHILRLAPAFVIELLSDGDSLAASKAKMEAWIRNGAELGWLIDRAGKLVWIYEPGKSHEVIAGSSVTGLGPVDGFVLDLDDLEGFAVNVVDRSVVDE